MNLDVELRLTALVVAISVIAPGFGWWAASPFRRLVDWAGRHPRGAVALTFVLQGSLLLVAGAMQRPVPAVHDEFSYLMQAETFAAGRLTNPTPPAWEHFETFHVLQRPTRQSKYPPGNALFLALGIVAFGDPLLGVWLGLSLGTAATVWALQGWMHPRWAFVGGWLMAFNHVLLRWWGLTYWGGGVALLGGALLWGAVPRIVERWRVRDALLFGLGLGLVSLTRPWEGFVTSLPAAVYVLVMAVRRGPGFGPLMGRAVIPATLVLSIAVGWHAAYNRAVTGHALELPYQTWTRTYEGSMTTQLVAIASNAGDTPAPVRSTLPEPQPQRPKSTTERVVFKLIANWHFHLRVLLLLAVTAVPLGLRDGRTWFVVFVACLGFVVILLAASRGHPHYLASITPLFVLLVVRGLRQLQLWRWGSRRCGRCLTVWIPIAWAAVGLWWLTTHWVGRPYFANHDWALERERVVAFLEIEVEGPVLAIVRYGPEHPRDFEWVYNHADLQAAKVVWARDLGSERDADLFATMPERSVWIVEADERPVVVRRFEPTDTGE